MPQLLGNIYFLKKKKLHNIDILPSSQFNFNEVSLKYTDLRLYETPFQTKLKLT